MFKNNILHQWKTMAVTLVIVYSLIVSHIVKAIILSGVTIESHPFLMTYNNSFTGLCVDVLDEIQNRTGINYSLYLVGDNQYGPGRMPRRKVTGLIGDLYEKKADFAIADMTVTTQRQQYVNFSKPFFTFSISALLHRKYAKNLYTLDDLAIKSNIPVGVIKNSNIMISMQPSRNNGRTIQFLYNRMQKNKSNLVQTQAEALHKIRIEPYAFLQEETRNANYAMQDCDLVHLVDKNFYFYGQYAVAFPVGSPYKKVFDIVLEQMETDGFLAQLKEKYFHNQCSARGGATRQIINSNAITLSLFGVILISFLSQRLIN